MAPCGSASLIPLDRIFFIYSLRAIGPGTMVLLANNTLAAWFDRRLGPAISLATFDGGSDGNHSRILFF